MKEKLEAQVIKGKGRGKKIGFPTINLDIRKENLPQKGVYITKCWYNNISYKGVSSISDNPTFADKHFSIELHLFDFNKQIPIEEKIQVKFLHKLRNQKKFANINDLTNQIKKDIEKAKKYFTKQIQ